MSLATKGMGTVMMNKMKLVRAVIFNLLAMLGMSVILVIPFAIYDLEPNLFTRVVILFTTIGLVIWLGNEYCFDECGEEKEEND